MFENQNKFLEYTYVNGHIHIMVKTWAKYLLLDSQTDLKETHKSKDN